jgi:hypothetical protein
MHQDLAITPRLGGVAADDPLEVVGFLPGIGPVASLRVGDVLLLLAGIVGVRIQQVHQAESVGDCFAVVVLHIAATHIPVRLEVAPHRYGPKLRPGGQRGRRLLNIV